VMFVCLSVTFKSGNRCSGRPSMHSAEGATASHDATIPIARAGVYRLDPWGDTLLGKQIG